MIVEGPSLDDFNDMAPLRRGAPLPQGSLHHHHQPRRHLQYVLPLAMLILLTVSALRKSFLMLPSSQKRGRHREDPFSAKGVERGNRWAKPKSDLKLWTKVGRQGNTSLSGAEQKSASTSAATATARASSPSSKTVASVSSLNASAGSPPPLGGAASSLPAGSQKPHGSSAAAGGSSAALKYEGETQKVLKGLEDHTGRTQEGNSTKTSHAQEQSSKDGPNKQRAAKGSSSDHSLHWPARAKASDQGMKKKPANAGGKGGGILPSVRLVTCLWENWDPQTQASACRSLASMLSLGYNVTLLTTDWIKSETARATGGTGARSLPTYLDAHDPQTIKVAAYRDWLQAHVQRNFADSLQQAMEDGGSSAPVPQENELILLVDAFDIVFQLPPTAFTAAIQALANSSHPIVASAEKNCYPTFAGEERFCASAPQSPWAAQYARLPQGMHTPNRRDFAWKSRENVAPRWLNSGCIGGDPSSLVKLLMGFTKEEVSKYNDQRLYLWRYFNGSHGIQLDFSSTICHSGYLATREVVQGADKGNSGKWQNNITGSTPVAFHFNGDSKSYKKTAAIWKSLKGRLRLDPTKPISGHLLDGNDAPMDFWGLCLDALRQPPV